MGGAHAAHWDRRRHRPRRHGAHGDERVDAGREQEEDGRRGRGVLEGGGQVEVDGIVVLDKVEIKSSTYLFSISISL